MSVDGTDFMIPEHGPKFYSFKFRRSGLRYEVGLCILTGDIVWINGPYEPGLWNDLEIFQDCLMHWMEQNERVEADDGYLGAHPEFVKCPHGIGNNPATLRMQARVRFRQETINKRFKNFECMKAVWRHEISRHGDAFRVIAILLQLTINTGERLFPVGYRDPPYEENEVKEEDDDVAAMAAAVVGAPWEDTEPREELNDDEKMEDLQNCSCNGRCRRTISYVDL
jgi:hypothetical protein